MRKLSLSELGLVYLQIFKAPRFADPFPPQNKDPEAWDHSSGVLPCGSLCIRICYVRPRTQGEFRPMEWTCPDI